MREQIFGHGRVQQWLHGDTALTLVLDSLDECLIRFTSLGQRLADELRSLLLTPVMTSEAFDRLCESVSGVSVDFSARPPITTLATTPSSLVALLNRYAQREGNAVFFDWPNLTEEERARLPQDVRDHLLRSRPLNRLYLRLACRTADWETSFTALREGLADLWDDGESFTFKLAPLSPEAVE